MAEAQGWAVIIAALGTLLLQTLGRIQAWHLAVIAIRSEVAQAEGRKEVVREVQSVHGLVNSQMSELSARLDRVTSENATLKVALSAFVERDARTADTAREGGAK